MRFDVNSRRVALVIIVEKVNMEINFIVILRGIEFWFQN